MIWEMCIGNHQYKETFSILKFTEEEITEKKNSNSSSQLENIQVTKEVISSSIKVFSYNSSADPDGIPAILLRKCSAVLTYPLIRLYET